MKYLFTLFLLISSNLFAATTNTTRIGLTNFASLTIDNIYAAANQYVLKSYTGTGAGGSSFIWNTPSNYWYLTVADFKGADAWSGGLLVGSNCTIAVGGGRMSSIQASSVYLPFENTSTNTYESTRGASMIYSNRTAWFCNVRQAYAVGPTFGMAIQYSDISNTYPLDVSIRDYSGTNFWSQRLTNNVTVQVGKQGWTEKIIHNFYGKFESPYDTNTTVPVSTNQIKGWMNVTVSNVVYQVPLYR